MAEVLLLPQFPPDLSGYALVGHTHSEYLTSHQSLANYATKTYVQNQISNIDFPDAGVSTFNGRSGAVSPKSGDYTASMVGAAASDHNHDSSYAAKSHTHSGYASSTHNHDSTYAKKSHTHSASDITGLDTSGGGSGTVEVFRTSTNLTLSKAAKCILATQDGASMSPTFATPGNGNLSIRLSSDGKTVQIPSGAAGTHVVVVVY